MKLLSALLHFRHVVLAAVHKHSFSYGFTWSVPAIIALVAGLLILIRPKLLNFIVAIYLILVGILGLFHVSW